MSTPFLFQQLADVEWLVVKYLSAQLVGVATVGLIVPDDDDIFTKLPFVRVTRSAGLGRARDRTDVPWIDIDVWDATNERVIECGRLVQAYMHAIERLIDPEVGATVTHVQEAVGPRRLPEDDPQLVRLGFTVQLTVRSFPTA